MQITLDEFAEATDNKCIICGCEFENLFSLRRNQYLRCKNCERMFILGCNLDLICQIELDASNDIVFTLCEEGMYMYNDDGLIKISSSTSLKEFAKMYKCYIMLL